MNRPSAPIQTRRLSAPSPLRAAAACTGLLSILIAAPVISAETSAQGTLTYSYNEDLVEQFGPQLVLEFTDGVTIWDEDMVGVEKLTVVLFAQDIAKSDFVTALEEKNGVPLFAATAVKLERYAMIDVCRREDGSDLGVCGVHFYGPAISSSRSGFGGFGAIVKDLSWANGRVSAKLQLPDSEESWDFEGMDLSFDLVVPEKSAASTSP